MCSIVTASKTTLKTSTSTSKMARKCRKLEKREKNSVFSVFYIFLGFFDVEAEFPGYFLTLSLLNILRSNGNVCKAPKNGKKTISGKFVAGPDSKTR